MKIESKELRKPREIILKNGRTLEEVLELHKKWLNREEGGERAYLSGEDLSYTDLIGINLSYATLSYTNLNNANLYKSILSDANLNNAYLKYSNLSEANLSLANLSYANLSGAYLSHADLSDVILRYANLSYTDLYKANLNEAILSEAILTNTKFYLTNLYQAKGDFVGVENIGSRNDTTHYFYKIDRVICGCFDGTMKQFEEKVKESYCENDKEYKEYMVAIRTLKELAELEIK